MKEIVFTVLVIMTLIGLIGMAVSVMIDNRLYERVFGWLTIIMMLMIIFILFSSL